MISSKPYSYPALARPLVTIVSAVCFIKFSLILQWKRFQLFQPIAIEIDGWQKSSFLTYPFEEFYLNHCLVQLNLPQAEEVEEEVLRSSSFTCTTTCLHTFICYAIPEFLFLIFYDRSGLFSHIFSYGGDYSLSTGATWSSTCCLELSSRLATVQVYRNCWRVVVQVLRANLFSSAIIVFRFFSDCISLNDSNLSSPIRSGISIKYAYKVTVGRLVTNEKNRLSADRLMNVRQRRR